MSLFSVGWKCRGPSIKERDPLTGLLTTAPFPHLQKVRKFDSVYIDLDWHIIWAVPQTDSKYLKGTSKGRCFS